MVHSALLSTIKLPFVFKTFVLSIFEWLIKTGRTILGFSEFYTRFQNVIGVYKTLASG